jgi:hypothetical protein
MPDFTNPDYLQHGTVRQQRAFAVLRHHRVFEILEPFDPVLTGTIPINIDIATSDLDIIGCFTDQALFSATVLNAFSSMQDFRLKEFQHNNIPTTVANFILDDFPVELFAQPVPVREQHAYRHMLIEHRLLQEKGEAFRNEIIALKLKGYKTEPAFAHILGLGGDPYEALLQLDS